MQALIIPRKLAKAEQYRWNLQRKARHVWQSGLPRRCSVGQGQAARYPHDHITNANYITLIMQFHEGRRLQRTHIALA